MTKHERDAEFDAHLDAIIIGERSPVPIVLADYDAQWPAHFADHRARIVAALGARAVLVEHIGSTSVPGLAAKPIIDVLLVVSDVEDEPAYLPALVAAGYELRVREPGHRMVRPALRDAHVHIYPVGHAEVTACIAFRDQLRRSEADRAAYEAVKRELARRSWLDMNYYARAKTEIIRTVLGHAGGS